MPEKLTGYLLLLLGLVVMAVSAYQVYQVFTGAVLPLGLTHSSGVAVSLAPNLPPTEILKGKDFDQLTNLALTYLLLTFFVSLGYKVASLGIQLLRTIEVKVQAKNS